MSLIPSISSGSIARAWRLHKTAFNPTWDNGEGSFRFGGRWNSKGVRAVYCAFEPSTAILECAVHSGFAALDTIPHSYTEFVVKDAAHIFFVQAADVPNRNWLYPGTVSAGQQAYGDGLLAIHRFIAIPSVVSEFSWNIIFIASEAVGAYEVVQQHQFNLDPRLNPAP